MRRDDYINHTGPQARNISSVGAVLPGLISGLRPPGLCRLLDRATGMKRPTTSRDEREEATSNAKEPCLYLLIDTRKYSSAHD
jgi:hypothetical protein